jgi:hypothetical protein
MMFLHILVVSSHFAEIQYPALVTIISYTEVACACTLLFFSLWGMWGARPRRGGTAEYYLGQLGVIFIRGGPGRNGKPHEEAVFQSPEARGIPRKADDRKKC